MQVRIGVLGGSGGVGASTFAAVLAWAAGGAVLVDLDPVGGGLDVLLSIEARPGARWSGVRVDGGRLDPTLLADGLPRWAGVPVLAADLSPPTASIEPVLAAAAAAGGVAVLDLPRGPSPQRDAAAERCDVVVVLAEARVRPLAAARAVLATLPDVPVGVLVRRGDVPVDEAVALLGSDPIGLVPVAARGVDLTGGRVQHGLARVAAGVVDALRTRAGALS